LAFIDEGIKNGESCLVHCNAGVSRSGAIVSEWVRRNIPEVNRDVEEAIHYVQERRRVHPNSNFVAQLKRIQQTEFS
jgi:protein-tyrosine phosphatase